MGTSKLSLKKKKEFFKLKKGKNEYEKLINNVKLVDVRPCCV